MSGKGSWAFRMKPRSVSRTIEWFPGFAQLEGENWNEESAFISDGTKRNVKTVRRKYLLTSHPELSENNGTTREEFLKGIKDPKSDVESNARNDKASFEFFGFGYVDGAEKVHSTKTGDIIVAGRFNDEYLLKQMLKMYISYDNPVTVLKRNDVSIFPMQLFLKVMEKFGEISKWEMSFLFMCSAIDELDSVYEAIDYFREKYSLLENKTKLAEVKDIIESAKNRYFPHITNKVTSFLDYADSFERALNYTGIFLSRGRGNYTKIYIPDHAKIKFEMLCDNYNFTLPCTTTGISDYMKWYGDPFNIILPWDNPESREYIVKSKLLKLQMIINSLDDPEILREKMSHIEDIEKGLNQPVVGYDFLVRADEILSSDILSINEKIFIEIGSKEQGARQEIIQKFDDIDAGTEDMAALWLEVNTWKSLVAIPGAHRVKRNFLMELDLSPKSFAPGTGNTPDMEVYVNGTILVPEVSLMSGVRQWEHEGSSVIDHVYKFVSEYKEKNVYGLFISKAMNIRTIWQFFILNKESWIGDKVPVIPLTIRQYIDVIDHIYREDKNIKDLVSLIEMINNNAINEDTFTSWEKNIEGLIGEWKQLQTCA